VGGVGGEQIDSSFLNFLPKMKTRETLRLFRVANMTDKRLSCDVVIDQSELYQNSRYTFTFEPESFVLEKVREKREMERSV